MLQQYFTQLIVASSCSVHIYRVGQKSKPDNFCNI